MAKPKEEQKNPFKKTQAERKKKERKKGGGPGPYLNTGPQQLVEGTTGRGGRGDTTAAP